MSCRLGCFFLGMDFVVGVWIESAEAVFAAVVRVGTAHDIGASVLQENHAFGDEIFGFVDYDTMHGAELSLPLGVLLRDGGYAGQRQNRRHQKEPLPRVHFFSPSTGSIRKTIRAS